MTYLELHEKLLGEGLASPEETCGGGLCNVLFNGGLLEDNGLFKSMFIEGINMSTDGVYWGYDGTPEKGNLGAGNRRFYEYTPLRQNIVLLMAAINGEL